MAKSSDPQAHITVERVAGVIKLAKRLEGHNNYGKDGKCDVLYSSDTVTWTFDLTRLRRPLPPSNFALSVKPVGE